VSFGVDDESAIARNILQKNLSTPPSYFALLIRDLLAIEG
jgi:hypothetical protein